MTRKRRPNVCPHCGDPCLDVRCAECAYELKYNRPAPASLREDRRWDGRRVVAALPVHDDEQGRSLNLDRDIEHLTEDQP